MRNSSDIICLHVLFLQCTCMQTYGPKLPQYYCVSYPDFKTQISQNVIILQHFRLLDLKNFWREFHEPKGEG